MYRGENERDEPPRRCVFGYCPDGSHYNLIRVDVYATAAAAAERWNFEDEAIAITNP